MRFRCSTLSCLYHLIIIFAFLCETFSRCWGRSVTPGFALSPLLLWTSGTPTLAPSRLSRHKWCAWSEWSRCAPVACRNQVRPNSALYTDNVVDDTDSVTDDGASYCVVQPTSKSRKVIWTAVVQYTSGGVTRTRTPLKKRTRVCSCPSFSILNLVGLFGQNQCIQGSEETHCVMCGADEPIYPDHKSTDENQLPFCGPFYQGTFHLYKILGGVAGGVVLVLFLVWLTRILCKTFSRTNRHSNRLRGNRSRGLSQPNGSQPRAGWSLNSVEPNGIGDGDPLNRQRAPRLDNDSPPAYKDVVRILPNTEFANSGDTSSLSEFFRSLYKSNLAVQPRSHSPHHTAGDPEAIASSSQNLADYTHTSSTPPPPSYEEVISGLRSFGIQLTDVPSASPLENTNTTNVEAPITSDSEPRATEPNPVSRIQSPLGPADDHATVPLAISGGRALN